MVDPINDIARQARQGSVSAIIQVLNEKLSDSGVRTRAVFEQGALQLLCEAATPEQLEQSTLVPRLRQILESLQPRRIRRVNINSRIVREQQLLWWEEIQRDGSNHLLWSEEIVLKRPNPIRRFFRDLGERQPIDPKTNFPKKSPSRFAREKRLFWRGLIGGASLSIFLLVVGWAVYNWLGRSSPQVAAENPSETANGDTATNGNTEVGGITSEGATSEDTTSEGATAAEPNSPSLIQVAPGTTGTTDPFADAVRLAQTAVEAGQTAQTPAEWQALAEQWQQASELMSQIPPNDPRYSVAQDRVAVYRQNSEAALLQAETN
jgi:hypothetical protein